MFDFFKFGFLGRAAVSVICVCLLWLFSDIVASAPDNPTINQRLKFSQILRDFNHNIPIISALTKI